jgi:undecaprenyl diphosphate synthase
MKLLEFYLTKEFNELIRKGIVFRTIGEVWRLPVSVQALLKNMQEKSSRNKGMTLVLALSYSGRNEIIRTVRKIISLGVKEEDVTEEYFGSLLDTAGMPAPDLIVRSSGEKRISNFLLWQAAYSEFYFTETLWPDFTKEEFFLALHNYQMRERRFGTVQTRAES